MTQFFFSHFKNILVDDQKNPDQEALNICKMEQEWQRHIVEK